VEPRGYPPPDRGGRRPGRQERQQEWLEQRPEGREDRRAPGRQGYRPADDGRGYPPADDGGRYQPADNGREYRPVGNGRAYRADDDSQGYRPAGDGRGYPAQDRPGYQLPERRRPPARQQDRPPYEQRDRAPWEQRDRPPNERRDRPPNERRDRAPYGQQNGRQDRGHYGQRDQRHGPAAGGKPEPARNVWAEDSAATDSFRAVGAGDARPGRRRRGPVIGWTAGLSAAALAVVGVFLVRGPLKSQSTPPPAAVANPSRPAASPSGSPAQHTSSSSASAAHDPAGPPASLGSGWKQTFNATFSGSKLDSSVWGTCYPWESQTGCTNFGNSDEYQWYTPSQDQVSDGSLHVVAQQAPTEGTTSGGSPKEYSYRSGLVTTFPGYQFQYGYIQIVAQLPAAKGLWTALWLAAANKKWPPEIDILEHWDNSGNYYQYYHPAGAPREDTFEKLGDLSGTWHTYGVNWTPSKITWFIDGRPVFVTGRNVPQQPMYFLANVSVYELQSLQTPSSLLIKSVTVWQQP
jgi:glycosyl hydrolase family 16